MTQLVKKILLIDDDSLIKWGRILAYFLGTLSAWGVFLAIVTWMIIEKVLKPDVERLRQANDAVMSKAESVESLKEMWSIISEGNEKLMGSLSNAAEALPIIIIGMSGVFFVMAMLYSRARELAIEKKRLKGGEQDK